MVICTVDYLLRLQESMMDFYWYYSRKEVVDPAGKANLFKAIGVASQVSSNGTPLPFPIWRLPCTSKAG